MQAEAGLGGLFPALPPSKLWPSVVWLVRYGSSSSPLSEFEALQLIIKLHPFRGEDYGFCETQKAVTFFFNVKGYFLPDKNYKQFPRSGDADAIKADKRFEVMFFRGEPLLFVLFLLKGHF